MGLRRLREVLRPVAARLRVQLIVTAEPADRERQRREHDETDEEEPPGARRAELHELGPDQANQGGPGVAGLVQGGAVKQRCHRIAAFPAVSSRNAASRSGTCVTSWWMAMPARSAASPIATASAPVMYAPPSPVGATTASPPSTAASFSGSGVRTRVRLRYVIEPITDATVPCAASRPAATM